jgi:hypothetical protein
MSRVFLPRHNYSQEDRVALPYTRKSSSKLEARPQFDIERLGRSPSHKILLINKFKILFLSCFVSVYSLSSIKAYGYCPSTLFSGEVDPPPQGSKDSLRLFAKKRTNGRVKWTPIPLQIDQVNQEGRLVFPDDPTYIETLTQTDLMLFSSRSFGDKIRGSQDLLPCSGPNIYELIDHQRKQFAYLTQCSPTSEKQPFPNAARFEPERHLLQSEGYRYHFNSENYLQFDRIEFLTTANEWETVARDSRMLIRSDVRRFFTMHFDSKQIESKLEKYRLGPLADLARLSFFLRLLFFRLDISLSTDVAFFNDAGHIPMMINIPVNSFDWLNPRSGILYTWVLSDKAQREPHNVKMPRLNVEEVKKGWSNLAKIGLDYCVGPDCVYKFGVKVGGRYLVMNLSLKKNLVEHGFFPIFVEDVATQKEAMNWKIDASPGTPRMGMYFEVSGLPKGGHPWEFWLKLGGEEMHDETCPRPYELKRIK